MRRTLLAIVVLLSACVDNESYIERAVGVPLLLGEFRSYASEQELRTSLASWSVREVERSSLDPRDKRPPFTIVRLAVADYSHIGFKGEVMLTFFNDRLMSAWFYADDFNGYMAALKNRQVVASADVTEKQAGDIHIWTHRDYQNRVYVGWSDRRLDDQSARWISRYS